MNKEEKERILKCVIAQINKERTPRKSHHFKRAAVIALAAVMVIACGAFTVKVLHLDSRLAALLGGTSDQIEQCVTNINASMEKNGIRVEAKQAVGDGHRVYILMEFTSLTDMKFDRTSYFEYCDVDLKEPVSQSVSLGPVSDAVSRDGKKLNFKLEITSEAPLNEQDVTLKLKNFGKMINVEEGKEQVLIKGNWKLRFHLRYKEVSRSFNPKAEIPLGKGTIRINKATISPISCFLEASVSKYADDVEAEWADLGGIKVKMKDGSQLPVLIDGSSWISGDEHSEGTIEGTFGKLIDMNQIKGLLIEGREIPLLR